MRRTIPALAVPALVAAMAVAAPAAAAPATGSRAAAGAVRAVADPATATDPGSRPHAVGSRPAGVPAGRRRALPTARPGWVRGAQARGAVDPDHRESVTVVLGWRDRPGLDALVHDLTTPGSPRYGRPLSPAAFRRRFAPTAAQVRTASAGLRDAGLTVDGRSGSGARIVAHGTARTIQRAFATNLNTYRVQGRTVQAATAAPTVPASVGGSVVAVQGLDSAGAFNRPQATPSPVFRNAGPCSTYFGEKTATGTPAAFGAVQSYAPCGYDGGQVRSAYGVRGGQDGAGQAVAIIDAYASPTIEADANTYAARHGGAAFAEGQLDQSLTPYWLTQTPATTDPSDQGGGEDPQGWYGEQTLDVEAVHAVAPKAKVVYAGARNAYDNALDNTLADVLDSGLAKIVSNSYGETEGDESPAGRAAFDQLAQQAVATGVGLYFSSGDNGDELVATGTRQADAPASNPYVTAVGGTSIGIGSSGQYLFERPWGTDKFALSADRTSWTPTPAIGSAYQSGGGGGTSAYAAQPDYQRGVVPDALATKYVDPDTKAPGTAPHRVVPDVAAIADPNTGFVVGQTQASSDGKVAYGEYRIGGTSLASPVFAALMSIVDQQRAVRGAPPIGFANPAFYALGADALHDVGATAPDPALAVVRNDYANSEDAKAGILTTLRGIGDTGTLTSTEGYDDTTGVGTPNGQAFLDQLAAAGTN